MRATCKGSDQTAHMRRLLRGFAGRTYHIVGNIMSRLKCVKLTLLKAKNDISVEKIHNLAFHNYHFAVW